MSLHARVLESGSEPGLPVSLPVTAEAWTQLCKKSKRPENVDIFAAPNRNTTPVALVERDKEVAPVKSNKEVAPVKSNAISQLESKQTVGSQAEALRLEAEKEQIEIDRLRLESELVHLRQVDEAVQLYLNGTTVESLLEGPRRDNVNKAFFLRLLELVNYEIETAEKQRLTELYEGLAEAVNRADPNRYTNIVEELRRDVAVEDAAAQAERRRLQQRRVRARDAVTNGLTGQNVSSAYERAVDMWVRQTMRGSSISNTSSAEDYEEGMDEVEDLSVTLYDSAAPPEEFVQGSLPLASLPTIMQFPASLPAQLLPLVFRAPPLEERDVRTLRQAVFTSDMLVNLTAEASSFLIVFRGRPPASAGETVGGKERHYRELLQRLRERTSFLSLPTLGPSSGSPGMVQRVRILALPEYTNGRQRELSSPIIISGGSGNVSLPLPALLQQQQQKMQQERERPQGPSDSSSDVADGTLVEPYSGLPFEPLFVVLSSAAVPRRPGALEYIGCAASLAAAAGTALVYSTALYSGSAQFMQQVQAGDLGTLDRALLLAGSLLGLQLVHEAGHWIAARVHGMSLSPPFTLPSLQLGLFGSITGLLSFPPSRTALFDLAVLGPLAGFAASLTAAAVGLQLTAAASPAELLGYPAVPTSFLTSSLLLYQLTDSALHITASLAASLQSAAATTSSLATVFADTAAGPGAGAAPAQALTALHPLAAAGLAGLMTNALNFLPVGRLDGGRAVMSVFGRRSAQAVSTVTLIAQAVSLLVDASSTGLFWLLAVVLLQRTQDLPPEDDITPVGTYSSGPAYYARMVAFASCVLLAAAALLPMPVETILGSTVTSTPPPL